MSIRLCYNHYMVTRCKKHLIYQSKSGFILPVVLITSIAMLVVLVASVSSIVSVRSSLSEQYLNKIAQNATEAGVAYAKACLDSNSGKPKWTDDNPLKPYTDCSGATLPSLRDCDIALNTKSECYVSYISDTLKSSFTVGLSSGNTATVAKNIKSSGMVSLLRDSGAKVWRQYNNNAIANYVAPVVNSHNLTININLSAAGSIKVNGDSASTISINTGDTVNLTPAPNSGYFFSSWTGDGCSASFSMPNNDLTCTAKFIHPVVRLLVVGGGGGGGSSYGGGGGAGGYIYNDALTLIPGKNYTVSVGSGGLANNMGGQSSMSGEYPTGSYSIYAYFGGSGGSNPIVSATDGGSGGGAFGNNSSQNAINYNGEAFDPTKSIGHSGGLNNWGTQYGAGGGGGAGGVGGTATNQTGGAGGVGLINDISGASKTYAAGGGGCLSGAGGSGGIGGSGASLYYNAGSGKVNTGSGGGGGCVTYGAGNGGSGVVIIAYPKDELSATGGAPTTVQDYNGSGVTYTVHTFTANGYFTVGS